MRHRPDYWELYASAGVDMMHSMGSTYTGTNITQNEQWLAREVAAVGPSLVHTLAVGIGSVSAPGDPSCAPPNVPAPWPTRYNWTEAGLAAFVGYVGKETAIPEINLYRHDMMQASADCVPSWYYNALQAFLEPAEDGTADET